MIKKILIVDDSPIARRMLKGSIPKDMDFVIIEAVNGKDGIEKFSEEHPDLVFLDLTMPVMDGYSALEELKKIDPNSIVIVLTADIQPKSLNRVMKLGAYTVIKKPAKPQSIEDIIEKASAKLNTMRGTK